MLATRFFTEIGPAIIACKRWSLLKSVQHASNKFRRKTPGSRVEIATLGDAVLAFLQHRNLKGLNNGANVKFIAIYC